MTFHPDDPRTWGGFKPQLIAHDVGRSHDRSTAVYGGQCPLEPNRIGISQFTELPHGFGTMLASALGQIDRAHGRNSLIVTDLSSDSSYGEILYREFGRRIIGVHIGAHGDGMNYEMRQVIGGFIPVYPVARTYLFQHLLTAMEAGHVRLVHGPECLQAYSQLEALEMEFKENAIRFRCPAAQHDDLAISIAMLVWFARHPHLRMWFAISKSSTDLG